MRLANLIVVLSLAPGFVACGSGGDSGADPDAAPPGSDASPDPRFGTPRVQFIVSEVRSSDGEQFYDGASVLGTAFESDPASFHTEIMRVGNCRMLGYDRPNCEPFCDGICASENVCEPFATFETVGTVTVSGLKESVSLTEFDGRYSASFASADIFDVGDEVTLSATGGAGGDFTLRAVGVSPIDANIGVALTLVDGQDNTLSFPTGQAGNRVRLELFSYNAAHGLPINRIIECDGPDTGSIVVPQAMIEAMPPANGSTFCVSIDCPNSLLTRYRADETVYEGSTAELLVQSVIGFPLIHE